MRVTVSLRGVNDVRQALRRSRERALLAMGDTLAEEARSVLAAAQALAPVKSGELKASAQVEERRARTRVQVKVLYKAPKSAAVHEGIHGYARRPGRTRGYRWLARAFEARIPGMVERILAGIRQRLG